MSSSANEAKVGQATTPTYKLSSYYITISDGLTRVERATEDEYLKQLALAQGVGRVEYLRGEWLKRKEYLDEVREWAGEMIGRENVR